MTDPKEKGGPTVANPIAIMKQAMADGRYHGGDTLLEMFANAAVAALEAAGFRIAHPDNVTDEMLAAAECAGDICPITDRGTIRQTRAAITAALRAAPLHGKG